MPDDPGAWLMTTAKRRAIDQLRRAKLAERTHEELGHDSEPQTMRDPDDDIAQRIVRAKRALAEAGVPFEVPVATERAARLASTRAMPRPRATTWPKKRG